MNELLHRAGIALFALFVATTAYGVTVVGTGDPNADIPAVQAAVDQGGLVILTGVFSFDRAATKPAGATYNRIITISKDVAIFGTTDGHDMATIQGGELPFAVDALGSRVTIERVRFVHPKAAAINVFAVGDLVIAHCSIEGVTALADAAVKGGLLANGILLGASRNVPNAAQPGHPENFSGTIAITNNDIDMQGAADSSGLGIVVFAVGVLPDRPVDILIAENSIRNTTEPAINFRYVGGRAQAVRNVISTGAISGSDPDVIRVIGSGSYLITENVISCGWPSGGAIHVGGQAAPLPSEFQATIAHNNIDMVPTGDTIRDGSAAIEILGFAKNNSVFENRIHGRADAGIALSDNAGGAPSNNVLLMNDLTSFQSSTADVVIDNGVSGTLLIGAQASLLDNGTATVILPVSMAADAGECSQRISAAAIQLPKPARCSND